MIPGFGVFYAFAVGAAIGVGGGIGGDGGSVVILYLLLHC